MRNVRLGRVLFVGCLLGLLLVILVIAAPAANAQVCPAWTDQVSCLQQDAYNIIHNARRQGRANQTVANLENLIFRGGYYGYYDGGVFNPVYDRNRRPIGRIERNVSLGAAAGLGVYGATGGGRAGLATGAILFGGLTAVDAIRGRGSNDRQPDCRKPVHKQKDWERETCSAIAAEQQAAIVRADYEARLQTGGKVYNHTGFPGELKDGDQWVMTMRPGQSKFLPEARRGYRMEMLVPDRSTPGRMIRVEADFRLANDRSGWVFTSPDRGGV